MRIDKNTKIYLGQTEIVKIKKGNVVIWEGEPAVEPDYFYIESLDDGNTVKFNLTINWTGLSNHPTPTIEYSTDKQNWTTVTFDWSTGNKTITIPTVLNTGDKMYFRNDTGKFSYSYFNGNLINLAYINVFNNKNANVGGDIRTLVNYRDVETSSITEGMFVYLFNNNTHIVDASNLRLPYTTLANYCYRYMFQNCSSLTSAPTTLPATTLVSNCYNSMFQGCTSLTTAPALPATTLNNASSCYENMFYGCTSLTTAPALPATTLNNASNCYDGMFYGCTSLTTAPTTLPATTLTQGCYYNMFHGCTSLTTAPALPATTLGIQCYSGMFYGCTSLTTAPALPATTLKQDCYHSMFLGCTSLTTAPALPATTLVDSCYKNMFYDCTALTTAPALPATTLASYCYNNMFNGCTSLTSAPVLPATTLVSNCYGGMFSGCSNLNTVLTYADDISASDCTLTWLENVAASGTLYNAGSAVYTTDSPSGIPTGWSETAAPTTSVYAVPDTFSAKSWQDKNRCDFTLMGRNASGIDIAIGKMSELVTIGKNTGSSTVTHTETLTYDGMDYTITINQTANDTDEPNYFYVETIDSDNVVNVNNYKYNNYTVSDLTPTIEYSTDKVNWNVITFDWTNTGLQQTISLNNVGDKVYFRNDTGLFSKFEDSNRYKYIYFTFGQNKRVNVGGDLRSLLDYRDVNNANMTKDGMFQNLFSPDNYSSLLNTMKIVDASSLELPATTTPYCYDHMFSGCTSLTTAPALPTTTLASFCYSHMFDGCTALTTAPALPATTLASYCYNNMFNGCTSLTSAPALPATTLATYCYQNMFKGCTSLTTAPALPATTLASDCYSSMFSGCSSLTTAPALPTTTLATYCYQNMFNGCSSLTSAPALPATTLATYCYYHMFDGCTSLETAPELPATTLKTYCYAYMFQNCSSLTSVTIYATSTATSAFYNWLNNVAASGTFYNNGLLDLPENSISGIPTGWTEVYPIQSIVADPDTFTLKSYQSNVRCASTLTITTTVGTTVTKTNLVRVTVGENTGDSTRTLTETIPYKGSSYQVTIVQTANDPVTKTWSVSSTGTYPFELNSNDYYESTNKGHDNSYSYATLTYEGYDELVLECINYGENKYDYGIISQPDVLLSESITDDGATGSANVFHNFKQESSATPVQLTIPSDKGSHFITIKFRKDSSTAAGNDSLQFKVIEPTT